MQPAMRALMEALEDATMEASAGIETDDWTRVREACRRALSAVSKMMARSQVLFELQEDAKFVAEVDRALAREKQSRGSSPIPGETPLPFPPAPRRGKRGPTSPRKGKG